MKLIKEIGAVICLWCITFYIDHDVERGGQVEPAGDVRRDEHVGRIPQRACLRQRLGVGDVDRGAGEMS